ncbi:fasciclin domain-containing protein [Spirosoma sp. HMF4905]|uniref:Fasciclin domain-containing protein n=2 Tax=Spirosoma arboris TaxID=2682092 RepID=A0A7K1SEF3_9BACT|nr:fasciclin domain-containing protein [Spirosoma arboris]
MPSATSSTTNGVLIASGVKTGNTLALSAAESPDHTTLLQLLKASGLTKQASGAGPYTVFAPNNGAFTEFSKEELDELLLPSSKNRLIQLLAYHVVKGRLTSDQLRDGQTLTNLTGQILTIHKQEDHITIEDGRGTVADVIQGNVRATNGVIYSINKVLQAASAKGPVVR